MGKSEKCNSKHEIEKLKKKGWASAKSNQNKQANSMF